MMMMMIYVCVYLGNESVKSRIINLFQKKKEMELLVRLGE